MTRRINATSSHADVPEGRRADCARIVDVARARGWEVSMDEAYRIWNEHSDNSSAGWLYLPFEDGDLFSLIECAIEALEGQ